MGKLTVAICACILMGSNSMSKCAEWLSDPSVMKEMGFKKKVSQRTINHAVELIGKNADEIIMRLWNGLDSSSLAKGVEDKGLQYRQKN